MAISVAILSAVFLLEYMRDLACIHFEVHVVHFYFSCGKTIDINKFIDALAVMEDKCINFTGGVMVNVECTYKPIDQYYYIKYIND